MDRIPTPETPRKLTFAGADGNRLSADLRGPETGRPVLLAHGGGQTRHAWGGTAERLVARGWAAITLDQRGHGDSEWVADRDYSFDAFARDIVCVADQVAAAFGPRPVSIGASLGGLASMLAEGESDRPILDALVLVDITPRVDPAGVEKILGFMAAHVERGFASLDEAADAIADYLPHRGRPSDLRGLTKNLRLGGDGRYRWHWDPGFLNARQAAAEDREAAQSRNIAAACALKPPVLIVRGRRSELVSEAHAREFLDHVPHAQYADVGDAGHMVAGDRNDVFTDAVLAFLDDL